jgi:hypothetical protein
MQMSPRDCWRKPLPLNRPVGHLLPRNRGEGTEIRNFKGTEKRQRPNNLPEAKRCYATCAHELHITLSVDRDSLGECILLRLECVDREKGDA